MVTDLQLYCQVCQISKLFTLFFRNIHKESPPALAAQMEGMVNDLQLAKEKERQFDDWRESKSINLPIDMNVTVLTTGFWPSYKVSPLKVQGWLGLNGVWPAVLTAAHNRATANTQCMMSCWVWTEEAGISSF